MPRIRLLRRRLRLSIRYQMPVTFALIVGLVVGTVFLWFYRFSSQQTLRRLATELAAIAEATAAGVDGDLHQALVESDLPPGRPLGEPRYRELVEWLYTVQKANGMVMLSDGTLVDRIYPYTYVAGERPDTLILIGSAGALLDPPAGAAFRDQHVTETYVMPGGLERTTTQVDKFIHDRWGTWITATSPIRDSAGKLIGAVGIDMRDTTVVAMQQDILRRLLPAMILFYLALVLVITLIARRVSDPLVDLAQAAKAIAEGTCYEPLELRSGAFRNELDTLCASFGDMGRRVHERESELAYSNARLNGLIESLPGPAFTCTLDGSMIYISSQIESLLGFRPDEWLAGDGRLWLQLMHPEDRGRLPDESDMAAHIPRMHQYEGRLLHKSGAYRWIETRFSTSGSDRQPFLTGILLDTESRRQSQDQLEAYAHELKIAYQELQDAQLQFVRSAQLVSVGELAAGVAHELNNPLAAVRGLAQLLLSERPADADLHEVMEQIVANTDRMDRAIRTLRGFARPSSFERCLVNLNDTLEQALTLLTAQLTNHQIRLAKVFDPDLPAVRGVPEQLEMVSVNLLTNARDAILEAERPGTITLRTWYDPGTQHVYMSVADTGVGIRPEHLTDIFVPFFTTKPDGHGTGLGLSTSYRTIQEHQGHIQVHSQRGAGTTFTVLLPAVDRWDHDE